MNSYGDPNTPYGRAQTPREEEEPQPGPDSYGRPGGAGRASVPPAGTGGRASVGGGSGRAQVGGPGRAQVPGGPGRAQVPGGAPGRAQVPGAVPGRAQVPGGPGRAQVPGGAPGRAQVPGAVPGRAQVPGAPGRAQVPGGAGRVSVGAAAVGAASVGGAGRVGARAAVSPDGGAPGGPGGPTGPGRGGRGGGAGKDPQALKRAKRRKRLNFVIAGFAVLIMMAGFGVVGLTYYSTGVVLPQHQNPPLATSIYYSDGKTVLAKLGQENRAFVKIEQLPDHVAYAVAAAEDRKFYEHSGVDYVGIARAAWNNVTGGTRQGASTITQQYARNAYDNLQDNTYSRKLKEAILASKLNDQFDKDEIMQHYLNTIYFGRGAHGIEAAAQAYFKKSATKLTVGEAVVLAGMIKQPEPAAGHKSYDPELNYDEAVGRWNWILDGMVGKGWLKAEERPTEFPKTRPRDSTGPGLDYGVETPVGNVVNYVRQELIEKGLCTSKADEVTESKPGCSQALMTRGYRIVTTIDVKAQKAAQAAARRAAKTSPMQGQPKNLMAAMVAIEPKTGRVLAYYGGESGVGTDYAGRNVDSSGNLTGGHPPGSSFKIYTLAAALEAGKSLQSRWKSDPFKPEGVGYTVRNAGTDTDKTTCGNQCTLDISTVHSYNVPFYHITEEIGRSKVIEMARNAGITKMWNTESSPAKVFDLDGDKMETLEGAFYDPIAYGQYPVTVLDHANGAATFANRGKYIKAHFLMTIEQMDQSTGEWHLIGGEQRKVTEKIRPEVADDVNAVLQKIPGYGGDNLDGGRPAAGKTGTWELERQPGENAHAWMVGWTPQIATAVWVGNVKNEKALRDKAGQKIYGSTLPSDIWKQFMNVALDGKPVEQFQPAANIGDPDAGNAPEQKPEPPPRNQGRPGGGGRDDDEQDCNPLNPFCNTEPDITPGGDAGGAGGGLPTPAVTVAPTPERRE